MTKSKYHNGKETISNREYTTAQVPCISKEEPQSDVASSIRNSPVTGRARLLKFG